MKDGKGGWIIRKEKIMRKKMEVLLNESILRPPSLHQIAGYAPIMPTYQGQVSEDALIDLVEYLKQLNSNYRIQQTLNTADVQKTSTQQPAATAQPGSAPHMVKQ